MNIEVAECDALVDHENVEPEGECGMEEVGCPVEQHPQNDEAAIGDDVQNQSTDDAVQSAFAENGFGQDAEVACESGWVRPVPRVSEEDIRAQCEDGQKFITHFFRGGSP